MGHAGEDVNAEVTRLAQKISRGQASTAEMVELALLLLEPCHRELEAVRILEMAHQHDPSDPEAALWLAYTLHHEVMTPEAVRRCAALLRPLATRDRPWAGAATLLLAGALDEIPATAAEQVRLLRDSVAAEPHWVNNHESLAWICLDAGLVDDARAEITAARAHIVAHRADWDVRRARFEVLITGRAGHDADGRISRTLAQASSHTVER